MRISDWSSDVCTADLRHIAKAEFEQLIAAPRLAIIVALRGRPAQYLDLAIVEPEAFVDARNLRFGGAFIGQENACRAAFDDRRRDRSEEHTSELQSLMRISYAVFCLKKKKNKYDAASTTYHSNTSKLTTRYNSKAHTNNTTYTPQSN